MTNKIRNAWRTYHQWALSKTGERIGIFLLLVMALYFLVGVFSARATTNVYGYDTPSECWADARDGSSWRGREHYEDEWELIVREEYDYYVADGRCYMVTDDMRRMVTLSYTMSTAENTVSIALAGWFLRESVGAIHAAATAIGTYWGIQATTRRDPLDIYVYINENDVIYALRDPCSAILQGAVTGTAAGAYLDCLSKNPRTTGPSNRTEAPGGSSSGSSSRTVVEILADLDSLTEEEWNALSDAERQQIIDVLVALAREEADALSQEDTADHTLGRLDRFLEQFREWERRQRD